MMENVEKIYFVPGNVVTLKHDIPNKPIMLVVEIVSNRFRGLSDVRGIRGIKCIWFTTDGLKQESIFSTKDLIKY